jgi:hypothetical protein
MRQTESRTDMHSDATRRDVLSRPTSTACPRGYCTETLRNPRFALTNDNDNDNDVWY